tara:strand:+ start:29 stop:292 length:264 start_codon:yes stop_codon:yes gene_type:complete
VENKEGKQKFLKALLKTKYGDKLKKGVKKKAEKVPLTLKALGAAGLAAMSKGDMDLAYEKKIDKDKSIKIKGNPKKRSIGLFFNKSF